MKKKSKKVLALLFNDAGLDEGPEVFYPEKKGEGDRFFANIVNNVGREMTHSFELKYFSKQQVLDARIVGECEAGEINYDSKRYKNYVRRLKARKKK